MKTCPAPFNQLYLHSTGRVYPCSFLQNDDQYYFGHIQKNTLVEIFNSDPIENFREKHRRLNAANLKCGPNQHKHLCNFLNTRNFYEPKPKTIQRLDIMLDSFCNLQCIMCTNIYDERGGFVDDFFWNNNDETFRQLKEIELVGGEPLISPYFFKLAAKMLSLNPQCRWRFTTNANYKMSEKLITALASLDLAGVSISLDSLKKDVFEKIRLNSNFDLVRSNINEFKKIFPKLHINMVVQMYNVREVPEMYTFSKNNGFLFYPILLMAPTAFSVLSWPEERLMPDLKFLLEQNQKLKSLEILILIKKILANSNIKKQPEIKLLYLEQLDYFKDVI